MFLLFQIRIFSSITYHCHKFLFFSISLRFGSHTTIQQTHNKAQQTMNTCTSTDADSFTLYKSIHVLYHCSQFHLTLINISVNKAEGIFSNIKRKVKKTSTLTLRRFVPPVEILRQPPSEATSPSSTTQVALRLFAPVDTMRALRNSPLTPDSIEQPLLSPFSASISSPLTTLSSSATPPKSPSPKKSPDSVHHVDTLLGVEDTPVAKVFPKQSASGRKYSSRLFRNLARASSTQRLTPNTPSTPQQSSVIVLPEWQGRKSAPDHWEEIPFGAERPVLDTLNIFPMKTPLGTKFLYNQFIQFGQYRVDTEMALGRKAAFVINLVGDLKEDRYDESDLLSDCEYMRIVTKTSAVPSDFDVGTFIDMIDRSIKKDPDGLILVHCTHGVNRTGYFICCYLVERCNIPAVHVAVSYFAVSRGVAIYDARLLEALFVKYNQKDSEMYTYALYPRHLTDYSKERNYKEVISNRKGNGFKLYSEQHTCLELQMYKTIIQNYSSVQK
jgi:protein-tyrosine phosphatase